MGIDLSAKIAVFLATFVGAAAAFNGAAMRPMRGSRSSASTMAVEDLVGGINDPIGQILGPMDSVWDPLGLGADEASLYRRRVVEIKHGRVCMVAFLGMTVGPNDLINAVPAAGWLQIIALVGVHELIINKQDYTKEPGEIPTFLGFKPEDPAVFRDKQAKELKNG